MRSIIGPGRTCPQTEVSSNILKPGTFQIKLFVKEGTPNEHLFENDINNFLSEKADSIELIDIKYNEVLTGRGSLWRTWTAMVIYRIKKSSNND